MAFVFESKKIESLALYHYNEWVETDGNGGWASCTLSGANSRRYHGLLVTSSSFAFERLVLLSKLEATIVSGNVRFDLSYSAYGDGYQDDTPPYLENFTKDIFPQWLYRAGDVLLKKTVCATHGKGDGEQTILIQYQVLEAAGEFELELLPLIAGRKYHTLMHANAAVNREAVFQDNSLRYQPYGPETLFYIGLPNATYQVNPMWYFNYFYAAEKERGQDYNEDLFTPGRLTVRLKPGETLWITLGTKDPSGKNAAQLFASERQRRLLLLKDLAVDEFSVDLILASDQFIVKTNWCDNTVIAGYHWFSDWGRDTMISLTGLCLVTKRFEEAKGILKNFSGRLNKGIIPNRFEDADNKPAYNTVDATLWFFIACYRYVQYTGNRAFVKDLTPIFRNIIDWHIKGTWYSIHADTDNLLWAGEDGVQLTWMDAKVGEWVVTPRTGKAVEVNALWYNAIMIFADFLEKSGDEHESLLMHDYAVTVKKHFQEQFWYSDGGYLYDCINGENRESAFRPNQLFAISLPFQLLEFSQSTSVLDQVEKKLYTSKGLRSLAPGSPGYQAWYSGTNVQRDGAYHQGTVWSWLLGPYVDALVSVRGKEGRAQARKAISAFSPHLNEAGIGSVSEIFDATYPYFPKGCIAQAWGVAEVLRVYMEHKLYLD